MSSSEAPSGQGNSMNDERSQVRTLPASRSRGRSHGALAALAAVAVVAALRRLFKGGKCRPVVVEELPDEKEDDPVEEESEVDSEEEEDLDEILERSVGGWVEGKLWMQEWIEQPRPEEQKEEEWNMEDEWMDVDTLKADWGV